MKSGLILWFHFVQQISRKNVQESNITADGVLMPSSVERLLNQQNIHIFQMENNLILQTRKYFYTIR